MYYLFYREMSHRRGQRYKLHEVLFTFCFDCIYLCIEQNVLCFELIHFNCHFHSTGVFSSLFSGSISRVIAYQHFNREISKYFRLLNVKSFGYCENYWALCKSLLFESIEFLQKVQKNCSLSVFDDVLLILWLVFYLNCIDFCRQTCPKSWMS